MNDEQFKKGIEELKGIRMTDAEKTRVLQSVLSTPIKSPYMKYLREFSLVACAIVLSFTTVVASANSLPGDVFYPVKTKIVEPVLDVVNYAPEDKVVWETEKVERRIVEAEKLSDKNELDDVRTAELGKQIEESSRAFVKAAEDSNGGKVEVRKDEFRKKFANRKKDGGESESKVEKLRRTAVETIDKENENN